MPTPESAAFLAKKPTVPPTFDGVDYDDTRRLKQAQDAIIREQWVKVMMGRLVREELSKCYYREGVNHLEKCGALRGQWHTTPIHKDRGRLEVVIDYNNIELVGIYSRTGLLTGRTERYLQLLKDNRVKGYLGEQQNYYDKQQ
jgi:hypothetical protein